MTSLMQMNNENNTGFMSASTASILQHIDQGVILTFRSYYLRNALHKAVAIERGSSDGHGEVK